MKLRLLVIAAAALAVVVAAPVLARDTHQVRPHCRPQPQEFSLYGLLFNRHPQPNGCAPPVYVNGEFVGQDPDPNIRMQLRRDPGTGYASDQMN